MALRKALLEKPLPAPAVLAAPLVREEKRAPESLKVILFTPLP